MCINGSELNPDARSPEVDGTSAESVVALAAGVEQDLKHEVKNKEKMCKIGSELNPDAQFPKVDRSSAESVVALAAGVEQDFKHEVESKEVNSDALGTGKTEICEPLTQERLNSGNINSAILRECRVVLVRWEQCGKSDIDDSQLSRDDEENMTGRVSTASDVSSIAASNDPNFPLQRPVDTPVTNKKDKAFKCFECDRSFSRKNALNMHQLYHKGIIFTCKLCDRNFSVKSSFLRHKYTHHRDGKSAGDGVKVKYECDVCKKSVTHLKTHFLDVHSGYKPYKCDICGKSFSQKATLERHEFIHSNCKRPFACEICDKSYIKKYELAKHLKSAHGNGVREFVCNICGKSFFYEQDLVRHHKALHLVVDKAFRCNVCNKSFKTKTYLVEHEKVHTGEKPYRCESCKKYFRQRSHLKTHQQRLHKFGEKRHACRLCDKSFYTRSELKFHQLEHTGVKPHECEICGKAFRLVTVLNSHRKIHGGEKQFKCSLCNKSCHQRNNLIGHINRKHNNVNLY